MVRPLSLQTRLLGGLTVLFVTAMTVLALVLLGAANQQHEQFELEQARYQARTLAESSVGAVIGEDYELMERLVAAAMPSRQFAYAALARPNGQVLTHTDLSMIGRTLPSVLENEVAEQDTDYKGRPVRIIVHPVRAGSKSVASARVAYYLDAHETLTSEAKYKILLTVVLLLVALGLGTMYVARNVVAPVKVLTVAVSDASLASGSSGNQLTRLIARRDEVGMLAESFRELMQRLREAYASLKQSHEMLEQRVEERTSELTRANLLIEQDRAYIAAIMDSVAEGILTLDPEGRIVQANRAVEHLLGYRANELNGQSSEVLVPNAARAVFLQQVRATTDQATAIPSSQDWQMNVRRKNGSEFPVELVMSTMQTENQQYRVLLMRDITQRKAEMDQLHHMANHDVLTGMYNRRYFLMEMERVLGLQQRGHQPPTALMFVDLDHFKEINDRFGHAAGDQVLQQISRRLLKRVRQSDIAARMGGDEFALLLFDVTIEIVLQLANELREVVGAYRFQQGNETARIGCSIGVTMVDSRSLTVADVLSQADQACYEAKRDGRNAVRLYGAEPVPEPIGPDPTGKIVPFKS